MYLFPSEVHAFLTVAQEAYEYCVVTEENEDEESVPV